MLTLTYRAKLDKIEAGSTEKNIFTTFLDGLFLQFLAGNFAEMYPKSPFSRNPLVESQILKRNAAHIEELLAWLCSTPLVTTYRINQLIPTASSFKGRLERLLCEKYSQPPTVFEIHGIPEVLCISALQTDAEVLEKSSNSQQREVVVDSCCGAALLRGAHLYAPGVLAMEAGTKVGERVRVYADLAAKCKKGTNNRYESTDKLYVGDGVVRMQRHQLYGQMVSTGIAVEMVSNISGVPSLGDLSSKEALLQNLPSIVCVRVLNPQPGELILDMCAAPGNKTTHIAEMMHDKGQIIALDKVSKKITSFSEKLENRGLRSIRTYAYDATKSHCSAVSVNEKSTSCELGPPPYACNTFDRILLDAPCSALGNRPLLAGHNLTPHMLESFPKVQRKLFEPAVQLLKPGGVLVYSTCTVTEDENEALVVWALNKFPQLQLAPASPRFGSPGLPQMGLSDEQRHCVQRFGPRTACMTKNSENHLDTVGFFIAKFIKQY